VHLYIHVPFCSRRCSYCDFAIAVRRTVPSNEFERVVLLEWTAWKSHAAWNASPVIDTIYFGGGTPSHLHPDAVENLLGRIGQDREISKGAEVTLEANPEDITAERADAWLRVGINRFSLGAQSFSPAALRWMHRTHSSSQIQTGIEALRSAGAINLSIDLIYGLPHEVERDWEADVDQALALRPQHLSIYGLTVEVSTPLARWTSRGEVRPMPEERVAEEYLAAHRKLERAGYEHYEVSNAALPGFRSRHNSAYWSRAPFLGLGPSAHSGFETTRSWNVREWEDYRRRVSEGSSAIGGGENLTSEQVELEALYLGLRTREGIPTRQIEGNQLAEWQKEGWATTEGDRARLTPEGWLRLDALVASLTHC